MANEGRFPGRRDAYTVLAHYYDAEHVSLTEDLEFYRDVADAAGPYILDLGCGTGRIGLELAAQGKFVIGVDTSDTMLTIANGKLRENRVPMELRRLDMRGLDYSNQFDLVICALDSFGHMLTIDDQEACLAGVHKSLKPGVVLALDVANASPDMLAARDGAVILQSEFEGANRVPIKHFVAWRIDYEAQQIRVDHMYDSTAPDETVKRRQSSYDLRYFSRFELELMLRAAGLSVQSEYSDYRRSEYSFSGERLLILASRE